MTTTGRIGTPLSELGRIALGAEAATVGDTMTLILPYRLRGRRQSDDKLTYRDAVKALGPAGYWRLGEASGTVAVDEMGAHNGTYANAPTLGVAGLLVGDSDTAARFTAASTQQMSAAAGGPSGVTNWTLCGWLKPTVLPQGSTNGGGFEFGGDSSGFGFAIANGAGGIGAVLTCFASGVGYISGLYTFPDTTSSHFLVATRDTTTIRIYVDANQTATSVVVPTGSTAAIHVGYGAGLFGSHTIDEVATFNRALTVPEITALYASGRGL